MALRSAPLVPDLTEEIMARAPAPTRKRRPARIALAVVAVAQLTLSVFQILGTAGGMPDPEHSMLGHLTHESTAWNVAVGVGLLWASFRPRTAAGQLPMVAGFVLVLGAFTASDLISGAATVQRLATHAFVVAGLILLCVVRYQHRDTRDPHPLADSDGDDDTSTDGHQSATERQRTSRPHNRSQRPTGRRHVA
jgi:predicted anti-sigma-YlaC factor YlaD